MRDADRSDVPAEMSEISFVDMVLLLRRHWRLLAIAPLLAGVAALGSTYLMPLTFTASTSFLPPQQQQSAASLLLGSLSGVAGVLGGGLGGLKNPAEQWVGMVQSRTVADAVIDRFGLQKVYGKEYRFQTRAELASNTRVSVGKDGMIDVDVDDHDPKRAAEIANAYVDQLQSMMRGMTLTEAGQRRVFYEQQLVQAKDQLVKAEDQLKESGVNANVMKMSPEAALKEVADLRAQITIQEVRLASMRGVFTTASPEVQQAILELNSMRAQLRKSEASNPASLDDGGGSGYVQRYRNFKYYESMYELLAKQYELAKLDEAGEGGGIQVVDRAVVPEWKSRPKRGVIAFIAYFAVLMLCIVGLMMRQAWKRARRD